WEVPYAAINFYGHKLVIIPVTIATGLSLAIIPALTKTFTQNVRTLLSNQINQAMLIIFVLVIHSVVGLMSLSVVSYGALFGLIHIVITNTVLLWTSLDAYI